MSQQHFDLLIDVAGKAGISITEIGGYRIKGGYWELLIQNSWIPTSELLKGAQA